MLQLTLKHLLAQGQVCCHHWGRQQGACCNQGSQGASGNLLCEAAAGITADSLDLDLAPAADLGSDLKQVELHNTVSTAARGYDKDSRGQVEEQGSTREGPAHIQPLLWAKSTFRLTECQRTQPAVHTGRVLA